MKKFTKSDLKDYMKVVQRDGLIRIKEGSGFVTANGYDKVFLFNEDLTWVGSNKFDIVEVYEPTLNGWNLLWKREEPKYMLLFPKEMFSVDCKLIECYGTYDRSDIDFNPHTDIKVEFKQEEINAIPFNTDMFTKDPVE